MMIKKIKISTMAMLIIMVSLFGMSNVFADFAGMDTVMTISPPSQRIILTPGEDFEGSISVSSLGTAKKDLVYSVSVGAFNYVRDEEGNVDYEDVDIDTITSYNQIMEWIEIKNDKGVVARGETEVIEFVIHVPKNAPAGGQYATIIVQDDTGAGDASGDGVFFESTVRFASNLIAEVTGDTKEDGVILENNFPSLLLNNKLEANSLVRNDGNVHTDASYVLQVWPLFSDEEICTNEENVSTSLIMPETERYHTEMCSLPMVGIFRAKQTVGIFGETSVMEKMIVVCPLWLLFLIILAIVAIIIYLVAQTKAHKNKNGA